MNVLRVKGIGKFLLCIYLWNVIVSILGLDRMVGAMWKALALLALLVLSPGGNGLFRSLYRNAHVSTPHKGDPGQPLFLTPYIEAGKFAEGKFKSETYLLV